MNILCSINERLIRPFKCMLYSLVENQTEDIDLYFVNLTLTSYQLSNLKEYATALRVQFHEITPSKDFLLQIEKTRCEQLEALNRAFSLECFVRVFAHLLLPEKITRVLWIDADCIIQKDISNFYNYNLFNNIGFATIDCYELDWNQRDYVRDSIKAPLGLTDEDTLFNSGVILLNLKEMRRDESFKLENLLKLLVEKPNFCFDQEILNYLCKEKIIINRELDFNYPPNWSTYEDITSNMRNMSILHYYGLHKPWIPTSNIPFIGIQPWTRAYKMSKIIDSLIERDCT